MFGFNSRQTPSNSNFLTFFLTSNPFFQSNNKGSQLRQCSKVNGFVQVLFCIFVIGEKVNFKKVSTLQQENFQTLLVVIFWKLYNILVQVRFTTNKRKLDIQYRKPSIRIAEKLKTIKLRKLGNIRKISGYVGHIAQCPISPFIKLDFGESSYKTHKNRYQILLFVPCFIEMRHLVPNIFPGLTEKTYFWS